MVLAIGAEVLIFMKRFNKLVYDRRVDESGHYSKKEEK
jgi:hypothetical protein